MHLTNFLGSTERSLIGALFRQGPKSDPVRFSDLISHLPALAVQGPGSNCFIHSLKANHEALIIVKAQS